MPALGKALVTPSGHTVDGAIFSLRAAVTYLSPMETVVHRKLPSDPVLTRLRAALDELYGARIERVVLFGSRARGDARADSDYDVALFLHDLGADRWQDLTALAAITEPILEATGSVLNILPLAAGLHLERTPLMHEIRRDGLEI